MVENGQPLDKETMMLIDKFESAIGESVKIDTVVKAAWQISRHLLVAVMLFFDRCLIHRALC